MRQENVTIIKCDGDGCREFRSVPGLKAGQSPEGWYRVAQQHDEKLGQAFEFHSLKCIERWASARRRITQDVNGKMVPSAENQALVLMAFQEWPDRPLTVLDLHTATGLSSDTIRRHANALADEGLVEVVDEGKRGKNRTWQLIPRSDDV